MASADISFIRTVWAARPTLVIRQSSGLPITTITNVLVSLPFPAGINGGGTGGAERPLFSAYTF